MSLFGAMVSGVAGMNAHTQTMGAISDNIANVRTVGYKTTSIDFSTFVTQSASATKYSPGGVNTSPTSLISKQGVLQASASNTDLAISGDGFFVVTTDSSPTTTSARYYTRAGSFRPDANGNLKNSAGYYLQGWPIDGNGNLPTNLNDVNALQTVNISSVNGTAESTTSVNMKANLNATQTINAAYAAGDSRTTPANADFLRSIQVYDEQGVAHTVNMAFEHSAANTWGVEVWSPDVGAGAANIMTGNIVFNTDGSLNIAGSTAALFSATTFTWDATTTGAGASSITFNWGTTGATDGMSQFNADSTLYEAEANGATFGSFAGVEVSDDGVVTAVFDNGLKRNVFKLPMGMFSNPDGLKSRSGNVYSVTVASGDLLLQQAGKGGSGTVAASALEESTVDIAEEFTTMIVTQRAYSASTKIISTSDQMLDELVRIKR